VACEPCILPAYDEDKYLAWQRSGLPVTMLPCAPPEVYSWSKMSKPGHSGAESERFRAARQLEWARGLGHSRIGVHHRSEDISVQGSRRGALNTLAKSTSRHFVTNDASGVRTLTGLEAARLHGYPEPAIRAYYTVRSHDQVQSCVGDGFTVVAVRDLFLELLRATGWLPRGRLAAALPHNVRYALAQRGRIVGAVIPPKG